MQHKLPAPSFLQWGGEEGAGFLHAKCQLMKGNLCLKAVGVDSSNIDLYFYFSGNVFLEESVSYWETL